MPRTPQTLDYDRPTSRRKVLGQKPPEAWDRIRAVTRIGFGFIPLTLAGYALVATFSEWPDRWKGGLFVGSVAAIAGYVCTVRPLWRMVRGGPWWNLE